MHVSKTLNLLIDIHMLMRIRILENSLLFVLLCLKLLSLLGWTIVQLNYYYVLNQHQENENFLFLFFCYFLI